jgi:tetratricopeptide (TPR) repeat protein
MERISRSGHVGALVTRLASIVIIVAPCLQGQRNQDAEMHAQRAQAAIASNQPDVASGELEALLRLTPNDINARANLGMVQFTRGRYEQAAANFETVLAHSPALWNARAFLGMCEIRLGRADEGQSAIQEALAHITDKTLHRQAGLELVSSYLAEGMADRAVSVVDVLEHDYPTDPDVLYATYRVHSGLASTALRQLSENAPDSAQFHQVLGDDMLVQEDFPKAIEEYRETLKRNPRSVGVHLGIGQAILAEGKSEDNLKSAEQEFHKELAIDPISPDALFQLGQIAYDRGEIGEATKLFTETLKRRQSFPEAHIALAKISSDRNQNADAIRHLEMAIMFAPYNQTAHYRLAQLYKKAGDAKKANQEFEIAQKLAAIDNRAMPINRPAERDR